MGWDKFIDLGEDEDEDADYDEDDRTPSEFQIALAVKAVIGAVWQDSNRSLNAVARVVRNLGMTGSMHLRLVEEQGGSRKWEFAPNTTYSTT